MPPPSEDVFGELTTGILMAGATKLGWNVTSKETKTMKFDVPIEKPQLDKLSLIWGEYKEGKVSYI